MSVYFLTIFWHMIKGIEYTPQMDQRLVKYQKTNLLTTKELSHKADLAESSIYKIRERKKISIKSIKKIKDNLGLDLVPSKK